MSEILKAFFGKKRPLEEVHFTEASKARHQQFRLSVHRYLLNSRLLVVLTAPVIWMCLVPIALLDLIGSIYQAICFPIYGIPKVQRSDYLAFDRHHLTYLNFIEKLNCEYCAYGTGIVAYFGRSPQERSSIGARSNTQDVRSACIVVTRSSLLLAMRKITGNMAKKSAGRFKISNPQKAEAQHHE